MKKQILLVGLFCSLASIATFAKTGQQLDQMVAIVNEELITRSELQHAVEAAKLQINRMPASASVSNQSIEKQALDQLINKKLQLQVAEQSGIKVSNEDVDKAIEKIAAQNNVSVNELYEHVKQEGMSPATYHDEIHDQIVIQSLQQREVASKVSVTAEEVSAFMKSKDFHDNSNNEYRLQDILIPLSEKPSAGELAAAQSRAETIKSKLKNGVPFNTLAEEQSHGTNALQGGDLGWRKIPEIPDAFVSHIASMQKNSIAGPIQTGNGLHILRMMDLRKLDDSNKVLADRKAVENMLLQQKFEQALLNFVSKLRSTAFISETV